MIDKDIERLENESYPLVFGDGRQAFQALDYVLCLLFARYIVSFVSREADQVLAAQLMRQLHLRFELPDEPVVVARIHHLSWGNPAGAVDATQLDATPVHRLAQGVQVACGKEPLEGRESPLRHLLQPLVNGFALGRLPRQGHLEGSVRKRPLLLSLGGSRSAVRQSQAASRRCTRRQEHSSVHLQSSLI